MTLKQKLDQDLKTSMLAGDKTKVLSLKSLKSAILYAEVAAGSREDGLNDEQVISILSKELKKRQESAQMYEKGGAKDKQEAELEEAKIIQEYLPAQLSDEEISKFIDDAIIKLGPVSSANMGQIIGSVKQSAGASADGGTIARLVKSRLA